MAQGMPLRRLGVALSLSVLSAMAAHAQSASVALDWSKFTIDVVDINPADGIDASVTIESPHTWATGCLGFPLGEACFDPDGVDHFDWTTAFFASYALGAMSGSAGYDAAQVHASASGWSPSDERAILAHRSAYLTFSGDAQVTVRLPYTLSVDETAADATHGSHAFASLNAYSIGQRQSRSIVAPRDGTLTHSGIFELGWSQVGGGSVRVSSTALAGIYHDPIPSPVPEPATWAMLLGGTALLARRAAQKLPRK
jgi:hypothetical protein